MAPSKRAKQARKAAKRGSAAAKGAWHLQLGAWHLNGEQGLEQDNDKAFAYFLTAANHGHAGAQSLLAKIYYEGMGLEQSYALAAEWGRKAADQGDAEGQYIVGKIYGLGEGVKKNLPLGKTYLELSAAQGEQKAVALLKELRKCVACGKLDVHHMICSQCRNVRYCDALCQLRHWQSPADPHKLHCCPRL